MIVNWPERLWCNSPVRRLVLARETAVFKSLRPLAPGGRFLEIGCGNGAGSVLLARAFAPRLLVALDLDPAMVRLAARKAPAELGGRARYVLGDAQRLPVPDRTFDAVFNFGIIHHLEDWEAGIREIARVLVPGGTFFFEEIFPPLYANAILRHIVAHPRENRFDGPRFKNALADAGLDLAPGLRESRFGVVGAAVMA